jgi:hypothetical protein
MSIYDVQHTYVMSYVYDQCHIIDYSSGRVPYE